MCEIGSWLHVSQIRTPSCRLKGAWKIQKASEAPTYQHFLPYLPYTVLQARIAAKWYPPFMKIKPMRKQGLKNIGTHSVPLWHQQGTTGVAAAETLSFINKNNKNLETLRPRCLLWKCNKMGRVFFYTHLFVDMIETFQEFHLIFTYCTVHSLPVHLCMADKF